LFFFRGKHAEKAVAVKKKAKQQLQMEDLASQLAAKYGGKKSKVSMSEPSEEEFLKARERLDARKNAAAPPKRKR
jgi:hypothetical protein